MTLRNRISALFAGRRPKNAGAQRAYAGAQVSRLTNDWIASVTQIDADIRNSLVIVRERARDLSKNNDIARKFLNLYRMNVLRPEAQPFKLQMNVTQFDGKAQKYVKDDLANTLIERAWTDFHRSANCSLTGQHNLREITDMLVRYLVRDGEAILHKIPSKSSKYGMLVEIIEPERLDEKFNAQFDNGNYVKMGVERNQSGRPVAYHFKKVNRVLEVYGTDSLSTERERIPAQDIIHLFDQEYANQTRGISWMVQSMIRLKHLSGYEEAAVIKARVAAANMGFFAPPQNSEEGFKGNDKDAAGNQVVMSSPGEFGQLPPGWKIESWNTDYPSGNHEPFMKTALHLTSAGLMTAYASLTNDLGDTSYSSARVGLLEEREWWKLVQQFIIERLMEPLFEAWLEMALAKGAIAYESGKSLPFNMDKFNAPVFYGKRWAWVDPRNDMEAAILARKAKLESLTEQLANQGKDTRETLQEIADEEKIANELGVSLAIDQPKPGPEPVPSPDAKPNDGKAKGKELIEEAIRILGDKSASKGILMDALETLERTNGNGKH